MVSTNLLAVSLTAFIAVFVLLGVLALVMGLITTIFPKVREAIATEHVAAITTTLYTIIPGSKVTRIEEIK